MAVACYLLVIWIEDFFFRCGAGKNGVVVGATIELQAVLAKRAASLHQMRLVALASSFEQVR